MNEITETPGWVYIGQVRRWGDKKCIVKNVNDYCDWPHWWDAGRLVDLLWEDGTSGTQTLHWVRMATTPA